MVKSIDYVNLLDLLRRCQRSTLRDNRSAIIAGLLKKKPVSVNASTFGKILGEGTNVYCFDTVCARFNKDELSRAIKNEGIASSLPDTFIIPGRMLVTLDSDDELASLEDNEMIQIHVNTLELLYDSDTVLMTSWQKNKKGAWVTKGIKWTKDVDGNPGSCPYGDSAIALLEYTDETKKFRIDFKSRPYCHGTTYEKFVTSESATDLKGNGAFTSDDGIQTIEGVLGSKLGENEDVQNSYTYDPNAREDNIVVDEFVKQGLGRKQIVEDRDKVKAPTPFVSELKKTVDDVKEKVMDRLQSFIDKGTDSDNSEFIKNFYSKLRKNWDSKRKDIISGKELFIAALERLIPSTRSSRKAEAGSRKLVDELGVSVLDIPENAEVSKVLEKKYPYLIVLSHMHNLLIYTIIQGIAKLRGSFNDIDEYGEKLGVDATSMILNNPYDLFILDSVNLADMDKLAMLFGHFTNMTEMHRESRYILAIHDYLTNGSDGTGGDTAMLLSTVESKLTIGYPLYAFDYDRLTKSGCIFEPANLGCIKEYINPEFSIDMCKYPNGKWEKAQTGYILKTPVDNIDVALKKFIDSGWGIKINIEGKDWIADSVLVMKEQEVYSRIYEMCSSPQKKKISQEDIDKCVMEFEQMRNRVLNIDNFKLEERQAYALKLIQNQVMVLTGPAGSGKTTTAEAIVYGLESLLGINPESIFFAAPTGKAANRLKEIVKRPTYTLHSLFGVGVGLDKMDISSILENEKNGTASTNKTVSERLDKMTTLIIDESSMIDINLMYNVITKLKDEVRIIFLGDIEQLPPIGFGKPFSNILRFAPCVRLTVSKRASDKSGITRNAKELIYNSDNSSRSDMQGCDDFAVINITGENQNSADRVVRDLCLYHLGKLSSPQVPILPAFKDRILQPDDIQIITPVRVEKYRWGSAALNDQLHDIFNPLQQGGKYVEMQVSKQKTVDYRIGDRVIHLKNDAKCNRWVDRGGDVLESLQSKGVMNGDVGKVKNFYLSTNVTFTDSDGSDSALGKDYTRDDSIFYVAVEYTDVDVADDNCSELKFLILYEIIANNIGTNYIMTNSKSLYDISLAYALTVHKMQGSQAKLIIMPIFNVGVRGFISRNMIYTGITRAQEGCYLIGSVYGRGSAVEQGRSYEATSARTSILDNL